MSTLQQPGDVRDTLQLSGDERYSSFVTAVREHGEVWTLQGEGGFVAFRDEAGYDCFPFWPAAEFAAASANDDWSDCTAESIDLDTFLSRWLPGMARDGRLVAVFPAPDGTSVLAEPLELLEELRAQPSAGQT